MGRREFIYLLKHLIWLAKVISIVWAERWIVREWEAVLMLRRCFTHMQYGSGWVSVTLAAFLFWLMSLFLFLPYLPLFFLYRMVTSVALWTLCASSPIQRQNVWVLFLFSLSFCLFFFAPSLSQLTVSSLSEDHFIPNLHVYYNINNITKKMKATIRHLNRFSFKRCFRFAWCIW